VKASDLSVAFEQMQDEAAQLAAAAEAGDGKAEPALLAEALLLAHRTARRMAKLRERLAGGLKGGRKR
jgi:hypothetical protein